MASRSGTAEHGSVRETRGVRVEVAPSYLASQSDPGASKYIFAYRVRVTNIGAEAVQLLARRWRIVNSEGEPHEVVGEGVVGQQPRLTPGASFEYSSFCPLPTAWGTMEGSYTFRTDAGERFEAEVGRFYLVASGV